MKKELTEQERFELARELFYLSAYLDAESEAAEIDDKTMQYRMDLIDRAIAVICPNFDEEFDKWISDAPSDPQIVAAMEEAAKSEDTEEFKRDTEAYQRGEMTLDEIKAKWHNGNRRNEPLPDGVIDFGKAKRERENK